MIAAFLDHSQLKPDLVGFHGEPPDQYLQSGASQLCVYTNHPERELPGQSHSTGLRGPPGCSFLSAIMVGVHTLDLEKFLVLDLEAPESEATILLPFDL